MLRVDLSLSFTDVFLRDTPEGRGVEIVVKRPQTQAEREELENFPIHPRGGWKVGFGDKSPYSTEIQDLNDVNESYFYGRLWAGSPGYSHIRVALQQAGKPAGEVVLIPFSAL